MLGDCVRRLVFKSNSAGLVRAIVVGRARGNQILLLNNLSAQSISSNSSNTDARINFVRNAHTTGATLGNEKPARKIEDLVDDLKADPNAPKEWKEISDVADKTTGAFNNFRLTEKTIKNLKNQGIDYLFPVQSNTFNEIYDEFDVIVQARTGSGKTMSYALPLVEKLLSTNTSKHDRRLPKLLVLTPTRELANQTAKVFESLSGELRVLAVYGGSNIAAQESQLRKGIDVVVGTPGRILDLISRTALNLQELNHVVLDEVDRMLDMGFDEDVENILKNRYHKDRRDENPQTLLFSATVPKWVRQTAKKYLSRDLKMIDLIGEHSVKTAVTVKHTAMLCSSSDRINAIMGALQKHAAADGEPARIIVFCQTKREVNDLAASRFLKGKVGALHGDISQNMREITLKKFKDGEISCLVATDVAARGLDIPDVDVVIQCSPPQDVESYIHRSGRTGRAGKSGESILLYTPSEAEDVSKVEHIAGFQFEKTQFQRSIQDAMADVSKTLNNVNERTKLQFEKFAQELMVEMGAVKFASAAVAILAGFEQKSLITFKPGLVTFHMKSDRQFDTSAQASWFVAQRLPGNISGKICHVRLCADRKGCVFDLPCYKESSALAEWKSDGLCELSVPEKLPVLEESDSEDRSRAFKSFYNKGQQFDKKNSRYSGDSVGSNFSGGYNKQKYSGDSVGSNFSGGYNKQKYSGDSVGSNFSGGYNKQKYSGGYDKPRYSKNYNKNDKHSGGQNSEPLHKRGLAIEDDFYN